MPPKEAFRLIRCCQAHQCRSEFQQAERLLLTSAPFARYALSWRGLALSVLRGSQHGLADAASVVLRSAPQRRFFSA